MLIITNRFDYLDMLQMLLMQFIDYKITQEKLKFCEFLYINILMSKLYVIDI